MKEGDRNIGFFHRMANLHQRRNTISKMRINGEFITGEEQLRLRIVKAFESMLADTGDWRANLVGLHFSRLNALEDENLEQQFTKAEVFNALNDLNGDKAPSPDGYTVAFWQSKWGTITEDVLKLFKDFFFETRKFVHGLNTTFIVHVPKKCGAEDLKDFRPISLVSSLYKLISKVLVNRLKNVISCVVNKAQNAFVEGRQILDASLLANEIIDSMVKEKETGILCKLDIEKAYNHISWNFLFTVLQQMGFGIKWISWIKWCITTASFSVLVNGSPGGFFRSSRGLRQGDPIFPIFVCLGMEVFSILVEKASTKGFLSGHKFVGRSEESLQISHLLFVDDTLVLCKDSEDQLSSLYWILLWFKAFSGLRINLEESVIMPVGPVENVDQLALELGCKVGALPTAYLGLPLGSRQASNSVWDSVEEKFQRNLAMWKR